MEDLNFCKTFASLIVDINLAPRLLAHNRLLTRRKVSKTSKKAPALLQGLWLNCCWQYI